MIACRFSRAAHAGPRTRPLHGLRCHRIACAVRPVFAAIESLGPPTRPVCVLRRPTIPVQFWRPAPVLVQFTNTRPADLQSLSIAVLVSRLPRDERERERKSERERERELRSCHVEGEAAGEVRNEPGAQIVSRYLAVAALYVALPHPRHLDTHNPPLLAASAARSSILLHDEGVLLITITLRKGSQFGVFREIWTPY